jgi:hypothetical protein
VPQLWGAFKQGMEAVPQPYPCELQYWLGGIQFGHELTFHPSLVSVAKQI